MGDALVLAGCGTLCPMMYRMALGWFDRDLGLLGGMISALCYLVVSATMAVAAALRPTSQATLGWLYVVLGVITAVMLSFALPAKPHSIAPNKREPCA